jgi:hypothetical protein
MQLGEGMRIRLRQIDRGTHDVVVFRVGVAQPRFPRTNNPLRGEVLPVFQPLPSWAFCSCSAASSGARRLVGDFPTTFRTMLYGSPRAVIFISPRPLPGSLQGPLALIASARRKLGDFRRLCDLGSGPYSRHPSQDWGEAFLPPHSEARR